MAETCRSNTCKQPEYFTLQTMFDILITLANRQLSDINSRYDVRAVDLKDIVVIDL
jgi:hypothetical protein